MKLTKHAKIRSQQRGFFEEDIILLMLLGEATEKPGNVMEYKIGKRHKDNLVSKFKQIIQRLDKLNKKAALVDRDDIITVYNLR